MAGQRAAGPPLRGFRALRRSDRGPHHRRARSACLRRDRDLHWHEQLLVAAPLPRAGAIQGPHRALGELQRRRGIQGQARAGRGRWGVRIRHLQRNIQGRCDVRHRHPRQARAHNPPHPERWSGHRFKHQSLPVFQPVHPGRPDRIHQPAHQEGFQPAAAQERRGAGACKNQGAESRAGHVRLLQVRLQERGIRGCDGPPRRAAVQRLLLHAHCGQSCVRRRAAVPLRCYRGLHRVPQHLPLPRQAPPRAEPRRHEPASELQAGDLRRLSDRNRILRLRAPRVRLHPAHRRDAGSAVDHGDQWRHQPARQGAHDGGGES
mmetsp:Transcript_23055/g.51695  ORF Transcript_23055/g.51695 Transcript_23055/m.51695 type:complete len:319 (-) Transcript_23055:611-1567(-)